MALEMSALRLTPPPPIKRLVEEGPFKPIPMKPGKSVYSTYEPSLEQVCRAWLEGQLPANETQSPSNKNVISYLWHRYVKQGISEVEIANIKRVASKTWRLLRFSIFEETYINWKERMAPLKRLPNYYLTGFKINSRALKSYLMSAVHRDRTLNDPSLKWFPDFFLDRVNCFGLLMLTPTTNSWCRFAVLQMKVFLKQRGLGEKQTTLWDINAFIARFGYNGLHILAERNLIAFEKLRTSFLQSYTQKTVKITLKNRGFAPQEVRPPHNSENLESNTIQKGAPCIIGMDYEGLVKSVDGDSESEYKFFPSLHLWKASDGNTTPSTSLLCKSLNDESFHLGLFENKKCPYSITLTIGGEKTLFEVCQTIEVAELDWNDRAKFPFPRIDEREKLLNALHISEEELKVNLG